MNKLFLVLTTLILICLFSTTTFAMVFPNKTWTYSTPQAQGMDPNILAEMDSMMEADAAQGILIRNGYIIKEWDYQGYHSDSQSMSKSINSLLLGIAIDKGLIASLDSKVIDYYPPAVSGHEYASQITFRHLISMTSGIAPNEQAFPSDPTTDVAPNTRYVYTNDQQVRVAQALTYLYDKDLMDVLQENVLDKIGANIEHWWTNGNIQASDGRNLVLRLGFAGIGWTPKNLARIGHLYVNKGNWNGQQIVSEEYINQSFTRVPFQIGPMELADPEWDNVTAAWSPPYAEHIAALGGLGYGLAWWNNGPGWHMHGHGMQFTYVWPDENIVLVKMNFYSCCHKYDQSFFAPILMQAVQGNPNPSNLAGTWNCTSHTDQTGNTTQSTIVLTSNGSSAIGQATSSSGNTYDVIAKINGDIRTDTWSNLGYWSTGVGQLSADNTSYISYWHASNESTGTDTCTKILTNSAVFVSQIVPTTLAPGETTEVSITMKNNGTTIWTTDKFKLGSQNPQDNSNWGLLRVSLNNNETITQNEEKTFTFNITAPSTTGTYNFQWKMLEPGIAWFGGTSTNVQIQVTAQTEPAICTQYPNDRFTNTEFTQHLAEWRNGNHSLIEIIRRAKLFKYC